MTNIVNPSQLPRSLFGVSSVVLPLLAMLAWAANHAWRSAHGERVELRVQGYDPRDLLSGHFLQYMVDYGTEAAPCALGASPDGATPQLSPEEPSSRELPNLEPQCVCLTRHADSSRHVAVWSKPCSDMPPCAVFVRGHCVGSRFEAGIERFYIPEGYQSQLAVVPDESSIVVSVSPDGDAHVLDFLVDGAPVSRYASDPGSR